MDRSTRPVGPELIGEGGGEHVSLAGNVAV